MEESVGRGEVTGANTEVPIGIELQQRQIKHSPLNYGTEWREYSVFLHIREREKCVLSQNS
jgi:hypothetical protein